MDNLIIRQLEINDFYYGYMELLYEFTNYKYNVSYADFSQYIKEMNNDIYILVIFDTNINKIIGAGTLFKIKKIHNNPIGQIEDVIITEKYRGLGLGKLIINKLKEIGLNNFRCYKIILNCLNTNINFYKKCGFSEAGVEMKL